MVDILDLVHYNPDGQSWDEYEQELYSRQMDEEDS